MNRREDAETGCRVNSFKKVGSEEEQRWSSGLRVISDQRHIFTFFKTEVCILGGMCSHEKATLQPRGGQSKGRLKSIFQLI